MAALGRQAGRCLRAEIDLMDHEIAFRAGDEKKRLTT
jgi:hypothetical protein